MLILTRRLQEKLMIREDIVIQILGVKGNQIRLGIAAPSDVKIYREEIYSQINERNTPFGTVISS